MESRFHRVVVMASAPSHQPVRGIPGWLILLGMLTAIGPLSIDMYLPSFPAIVAALNTDAGGVQRTLSTFFIGLALGQLIYGPLSDRFGRKPPLYVGLALYALAALGCALAATAPSLQFWRFIQALGGCAGMVIARAVISDRCDAAGSARALSLIMLVMGLAPILAPFIGGLILQWLGWRAIFGLLAAFGIVSLIAIHFGMTETLDRHSAAPLRGRHIARNYAELLRDRQFISYTLCGGLTQAGMFTYIAGSPFVLIELYGIPAEHYGWVFGANAFGLIAAAQINGRLVGRIAPATLLARALWAPVVFGSLMAALALSGHTGLAILLPCLFGFVASLGFISPNSTAMAMQHQRARAGAASALMGTLQLSLAALASIAISAWHADNELPLTVIMAGCGIGAWLLYYGVARHVRA